MSGSGSDSGSRLGTSGSGSDSGSRLGASGSGSEPLLSVRDLRVEFRARESTVYAVNGVSFDLRAGDTLGIVGESGCGKSVSSLAILGILPRAGHVAGGQVRFQGRDLLGLPQSELRQIRGKDIAMVFQDPMTSLNPVLPVGRQITEALRKHLGMGKDEARQEAASLLDRVGIPAAKDRLDDYPHQFSGGMRQRAMIAMAISCRPKVLLADEPTTALDVTIQAQILDLLRTLVAEERMALVLVTHDLGVVAGTVDRTHVMYAGRFVETAPTAELFARPKHPYTVGLLRSVPRLDLGGRRRLVPIAGTPRDQTQPLTGCAFAPRCSYASQESWDELPELQPVEGTGGDHQIACFNPVPEEDLVDAGLRSASDASAGPQADDAGLRSASDASAGPQADDAGLRSASDASAGPQADDAGLRSASDASDDDVEAGS
jgi:oligopeptide/dipeptide ABC transporter ATP-binding protein